MYTKAIICGIPFDGLKIMKSQYAGYDPHHNESFPVGAMIVYMHQSKLTQEQIESIFPDKKSHPLTVQWPIRSDVKIAEIAEIANPVLPQVTFTPSQYQNDILSDVVNTDFHVLVNALAGSGKTSTLVWLIKEMAKRGLVAGKRIIYLAFNTSIKDELSQQLVGTGVPAMTTHGFGFKALRKQFGPDIRPHNGKMARDAFVRILCNENGFPHTAEAFKNVRNLDEYKLNSAVLEMVGYVKNWAVFPTMGEHGWEFNESQKVAITGFVDEYEVEFDRQIYIIDKLVEYVVRVVIETLPDKNGALYEIDYDDMLYMPLLLNLDLGQYDLVLTDESQDFNACQILMLEKIINS